MYCMNSVWRMCLWMGEGWTVICYPVEELKVWTPIPQSTNVMFLLVPPAQHEAFSLCDNLNLSHHLSVQHVQYVIGHIFVEISHINVYKAVWTFIAMVFFPSKTYQKHLHKIQVRFPFAKTAKVATDMENLGSSRGLKYWTMSLYLLLKLLRRFLVPIHCKSLCTVHHESLNDCSVFQYH